MVKLEGKQYLVISMVEADRSPRIALFKFKTKHRRKKSLLEANKPEGFEIEGEPAYIIDGAETFLGVAKGDVIYFLTNQALVSGDVVDQGLARLSSPSSVKKMTLD